MATKKDLQAEADRLGLEFTTSTTKAELEELIEGAEVPNTEAANDAPSPHKRCPVCRTIHDHVHA